LNAGSRCCDRHNAKGATPSPESIAPFKKKLTYSLALPSFLALAHLALAMADSLALAAALICLLGFWVGSAASLVVPALACLFATPARMLARP
jgi:hypothetical protein